MQFSKISLSEMTWPRATKIVQVMPLESKLTPPRSCKNLSLDIWCTTLVVLCTRVVKFPDCTFNFIVLRLRKKTKRLYINNMFNKYYIKISQKTNNA